MFEPQSKTAKRFNAKESRFHGKYAKSLADTLYQAFRPALARTIGFLLLGMVGRFALLGNANLIGYWVDSFCVDPVTCRPVPEVFSGFGSSDFLSLLGFATGVGFLFTLVYRIGISRISAEAVSRVYDETTLRTSRLPMSFFDQNPAGRVMTRFASDYNSIFRIFGGPLAEFIGLIFDLLVMSVLITVASPWFLPFWLLQAVLNFAVYRGFLPTLRKERRETARKRSPGIAHFAETAHGANTIRAYGRQSEFESRFSKLNDGYLSQRKKSMRAFVSFSVSMTAVTAGMFLITGLVSAVLVRSGQLSIGSIGVAFAYLGLSSNILQSFFEWLGQFEEALTGLERMNEYLRSDLEAGSMLPKSAQFQTGHAVERTDATATRGSPRQWDGVGDGASIDIRGLQLRYREDLPPILRGIDLQIRAGERIAVIGKTGSGKTTLVQALFRLYPIESGSIRVAGVEAHVNGSADSDVVDLQQYRTLLAYITQEATLFLGTLRENLKGPGAVQDQGDSQLVEALKRVQFLRTDATHEEYQYWLDYQVDERGRNLSAGERQLVCMARCLLQDTPVVVLDEATSAVDPRSEEILTRATEEVFVGKTQILIAHRLSTIRSCDRVLWLENGRVHRLGTPAEVLPEFERSESRA